MGMSARVSNAVPKAAILVASLIAPAVFAATPGLPFTEDFADTTLRDAAETTADWNTAAGALMRPRVYHCAHVPAEREQEKTYEDTRPNWPDSGTRQSAAR